MIRYVIKALGFVRPALVASVALPFVMAVSAYAQTSAGTPASELPESGPGPAPAPAPASAGEASTERVIVTGSYIPTAEEVTASPLDTLTTQEIRRAGTDDVLTILQKRNPDFVGAGNLANSNANIASGATQGGSTVTIRGLATLVLFENRRIADSAAIATGGLQFSDVNLFPVALISRIEVLKDGASALYGSEAVGGVVNIFLKDEFEGVELGARYGFSVEPGVAERRAYLIAGSGNDTTHVTAGFQYLEEDPLFARERLYSQRRPQGTTTTFAGVGRDATSGTNGYYLLNGVDPNQPFGTAGLNSPFDAPGVVTGLVPPPPAAGPNPGQYSQLPQAYNQAPTFTSSSYNLFQVPTSTLDISNTNAYASFTHQVFGKQLELFGNFLFSKEHTENYLNAQPLSNGSGVVIRGSVRFDPDAGPIGPDGAPIGALVPEDRGNPAPFNPFQLSIDTGTLGGSGLAGRYRLIAANRYQTIAPRRFVNDTTFYRFLTGLRSNFAPDWTAETSVYYSHYSIDFTNSGLVILDALNNLINASNPDGSPIQGTTLDFFARNPVGTGPGQVSPATIATAFGTNIRKQDSFQEVFDGRITGLPFSLPGGKVGIAVGAEYREEGFKAQDSPEIFIGSTPIQPIDVTRSVTSAYAEASIPIVGSTMNVPFVYNLELDLAGRYDHYEGVNKDAKVPKVTLRYQPIKDLTLRATYSNSFVAPNLYQLVGPTGQGFSPTITLKNPATGVAEVQDQAQGLFPANSALVPSTAESYTAGMVYSPSFVPGLTITADYFRTLQQGIVGVNGAATILNSVNDLGPASPFASQVSIGNFPGQPGARRVTGPGQLYDSLLSTFYVDPLVNAGAARVEGFDLSARYNLDLQRWGQLELGINSVVFTKQDLKRLATTHYYNIGGLDQAEGLGATPDYKITFLAEYRFQGATLSMNANYIPELLDAVGSDPENDDQSTYETIEDYIQVDGRLSYTFKGKTMPGPVVDAKDAKTMMDGKGGGGVAGAPQMSAVQRLLDGTTVAVGCNNIFDEDPRFVPRQNGATDLSVYDPYGRFVYFEVSKKF